MLMTLAKKHARNSVGGTLKNAPKIIVIFDPQEHASKGGNSHWTRTPNPDLGPGGKCRLGRRSPRPPSHHVKAKPTPALLMLLIGRSVRKMTVLGLEIQNGPQWGPNSADDAAAASSAQLGPHFGLIDSRRGDQNPNSAQADHAVARKCIFLCKSEATF